MIRKLEDVVPKKSIKIERIDARMADVSPRREIFREKAPDPRPERTKPASSGPRRRYGLWAVAVLALLFFIFALSILFAKASVVINPKTEKIALNENLSAAKNASNETAPSFDLVIISGEEEKLVEAKEEKETAVKARGSVVIYNAFSTAPQKLSIDTRLEGSNGKIYKTVKEITVPGMKSGGTPGSVETGIYASEAGEAYNSGPLDFKIFGFKGTPKYEKFYGRSKGEIAGGLLGKVPFISEDLRASTASALKQDLEAKLLKKVRDQIPPGFILFKDAVFLMAGAENADYKRAKEGVVPVVLKGTLYGLLFDEKKLTRHLAEEAIPDFDGSEVYISNLEDIKFSLYNKEYVSFAEAKNIDFNLSGEARFVFKFDEDKFIADILGQPKNSFNAILSKYPNVDSADLKLRPLWKMSLPDKREDIEILVNYPPQN